MKIELISTLGLTALDGDGTDGSLIYRGSIDDLNAAFDYGVSCRPNDPSNGDDGLSIVVSDGIDQASAPVTLPEVVDIELDPIV